MINIVKLHRIYLLAILFISAFGLKAQITIVSPTVNDQAKFKETLTLTWDNIALGTNDLYYYYYSVDGGGFTNITAQYAYSIPQVGNQMSYVWTIPDLGADNESQVRVKIWNQTLNLSDTSDAFRIYYEPNVTVVSPISTDERKFSETLDFTWDNGDYGTNDLYYYYYSVDGGGFTNITAQYAYSIPQVGNQMSYVWTIPDLGADNESQVRVRIWNQTRNVSDTSDAFRIYYEPSVLVVSPISTDERKFGETLTLTWDNGDYGTNDLYYYYYSVDGGSFSNISGHYAYSIPQVGNQMSYVWTIPDLGGDNESQVRVRIWNQTRNVADTSDSFRIYYEPSVSITSPTDGEFIPLSTTKVINWNNGDIGTSDLFYWYYSIDGGAFVNISGQYAYAISQVDATMSVNWNVPATPSTNVKFKVWNQTRNVEDITASFFICDVCPPIAIYSPNGGEVYAVGQNANIGWSLGEANWSPTDNVVIDFSSNGGTTYDTPVIYDGSYDPISGNLIPLTIPNVLTDLGKIRITNTTTTDVDESDGTFKIVKGSLAQPTNVFALENTNGTVTLTWIDNEDAETAYKIQYSADNINWLEYSGVLAANTQTYITGGLGNLSYWWRVVVQNEIVQSESLSKYAGGLPAPGKALKLDGIDDYVTIPDSDEWTISSSDFTFEFWFKAADLSGTPTLISQSVGSATSGSSFYIGLNYNGQGSLDLYTTSGTSWTNELHSDAGIISTDRWYHAAFTRTAGSASIYLNGQVIASTGSIATTVADGTRPIEIGAQNGAAYFNGQLDEFGFWKVARTETEISNGLFLERNGNETGLIAYYKFDQTQGATLPDRTITGLNGDVIGGSPQWVTSNALFIEPNFSFTGIDPNVGFTFTDVDASSKSAAELSYLITGEYLQGNVQLSVVADNGGGTHPGFDISLNQSSYSTSATILHAEATNKSVFVRAIVPANNGRTYSGKIIHSTVGGSNVEIPIAVTELYQPATVAISSPADGSVFVPGTAVTLQWATTNMSNEPLVVSYSTDGIDFTPVFTTINSVTSYSVNTTTFTEGAYYFMVSAGNLPVPVSDTVLVNLQNADPVVAATNYFANENTNSSVTFTWLDNSSTETGYRIEISSDNDVWSDYSGNLGVDVQTYTTPGIGSLQSFWWRVVAFNASSTAASVSKFAGRITPPGNAYSFDGIDDYIELADPTAFDFGTGDFTAEVWFNTNDATANQSLINDYPGSATSYFALYLDGGGLKAALSNGVADLQTAQSIQINKWYHAALVRSGDVVSIYVDGVLSATISGMAARNVASTGPVNLGRQVGGGSQLNGELDEVRIWNVARTENQINGNLYNTLNGNEAGLLAYYKFDQSGNSTILPDRTVNNLNGTVNNGAAGNVSPTWVTSQALTQIIPTLTVTSPNGGENWIAGSTQTISWFAENIASTDLIEIRLSTDGGANYSIINDDTFGTYPDNSFTWTVPSLATNQARIQVVNTTTGLSDISNSNFTIVEPAISLVSPIAGAFWEIGLQYNIGWTSAGFSSSDQISIEVSRDGGSTYELISEGIYLINYINNNFVWTAAGLASDNVVVKVTNVTKGISAVNVVPISIGTIIRIFTLTSPNGGETFMQQTPWAFTWTSEGMVSTDNLRIDRSVDGGITFPYMPVNSTFGSFPDNTVTWNSGLIPTTNNAIVRISNITHQIQDVSDEPFTIIPAADVIAPGFNSQPLVNIGNQNVDITVNLNESGTVYYVGLADGSSIPTATQIKEITPQTPLEGQLIAGSFAYNEPNLAQSVSGTGAFIIGSIYDFYFTAVDAEGNVNEGISRPNVKAIRVYTPLEKDSIALRTMYDAMGGSDWTDIANNWTASPITDWSEITISDDRVTAVNLSGKGLVGSMPDIVSQLNQLITFDVSNNDISYVASFSEVVSITSLDMRNNRLSFIPILNNLNVKGLAYDPQKPYGDEPVYDRVQAASNKTLFAPYLGPNVVYEWQFGELIPGQFFNNDLKELAGGKVQNYTIQNINATNQGTYRFFATHPSLEGFVIQGRNQNILGITDLKGTIRSNGSPIAGGELFIYRQTPEGPFAKEDSALVQSNGTYSLVGVVLGNFIIQVKPDRTNNPTAIQTYYISAETYEEADVLILDSKKENIDIDLQFYIPGPVNLEGATIGGLLESELEDPEVEEGNRVNARRKVKKAACAMRRFKAQGRDDQDDVETEIAYYIETDDDGFFNFENVDYGRYLINIQFPGVPMNPDSDVEFFIDPDKENQIFDVNALITEFGIEVTADEILFNWKPYLKDVVLYPNPTNGILGMDYTVYRNINDLRIQIHNMEGRLLKSQESEHLPGRHHTTLDLTDFATGVYFMILTDKSGTFQQQMKVTRR
jgi:hypothetical protein